MGILDKFKNKKSDEASKKAPASAKATAGDDLQSAKVKVDEKVNVEKKVKSEKPKVDAEKTKKDAAVKSDMSDSDRINSYVGVLLRPIVSEKNSGLVQLNQYVFEISANSNKLQVAQAVKAKYGVEPLRVNVSNLIGKKVRHGKYSGKQKDTRKAIVFLPEGKSINVSEGA